MLREGLEIGLTAEGMVSAWSWLNGSQGSVWFPLTMGILGALPTICGCAEMLIHGDPESDQSMWDLIRDNRFEY